MICREEGCAIASFSIVFCGRDVISDLNRRFLNHEDSTDVISFGLNEEHEPVDAEIYLCCDVARKQAEENNVPYGEEIIRLIVHGVLHQLGYNDTDDRLRDTMLERGECYVRRISAFADSAFKSESEI